jgi:DNA invertase Pin-like site-specific DNA recombinase
VYVHGYCRATLFDQVQSVEAQKTAIRDYARSHALRPEPPSNGGLPPPENVLWYVDTAGAGKHMLHDRLAGGALCRNLRAGDDLVVSRLDRAFRRLSEFVAMLADLRARGIRLHVVDMPGGAVDLAGPIGLYLTHVLPAFAQLDRVSRAERTGAAARARRAEGLGLGHAAYGYKYRARYRRLPSGRMERRLRQVPDEAERRVMGMIAAWREQEPSWSYDQIRQKLEYEHKVPTRSGREWTTSRVRQMYEAEVALRRREANVERILSELRGQAAPAPPRPDPSAPTR